MSLFIHLVVASLAWLSPATPAKVVQTYADLIAFEAHWYNIDPLIVVSIIHIESGWKPRKKSVTNDYGLMQVHVARRGSSNFYGREKELYDPRTNIREGTRLLAMWKYYHNHWCKGDHPYWAHYKYGKRITGPITHALKVKALRDALDHRLGRYRKQRELSRAD
jgi:hypothetical protein